MLLDDVDALFKLVLRAPLCAYASEGRIRRKGGRAKGDVAEAQRAIQRGGVASG